MEKRVHLKTIEDVKEFVSLVSSANFDIDLMNERYVIDAKSIMGILSLDFSKPIVMVLHTEDSGELLHKLEKFIVE